MTRKRLMMFTLLSTTVASLTACGGGTGSSEDAGVAPAPPAGLPGSPAPSPSTTTACDTASGRVLLVGPGKPYAVPSAAAAVAQSGDVVKITAGDYHGDVATWSVSNLTICGVGGRARLFADGRNAQGKGLWVIGGGNVTVDSVEFHGTKVADQNGAGIRAENTGSLLIRNSGFYDNENGILGPNGSGTLTIDRSEFARNGFGTGYTHNIYVGNAAKLTVTSSYFHEAKVGHNLKSRARESVIENSYFMDGPTGTSSYLADFPNGGKVYLRGNLFHKGPNAQNSTAISFGAEGLAASVNTLEVVHNTLVSTRSGGNFLSAPAGTQSLKLTANILAGTGGTGLITGGFASGNIAQAGNVSTSATHLPGASNISAPNFWPNATLQAQIGLTAALDPTYANDAPVPFTLRSIAGSGRVSGAVQSAP
jgi:hypothetical protein